MVQDVVNFRFACYGYFAIVYSLLIAAISSIVQSQLTQRDTVFVIVAVASPATVYLWFLTAIHLIRPKSMPLSLSRMNKIEKFLVSILSVCLFSFGLPRSQLYSFRPPLSPSANRRATSNMNCTMLWNRFGQYCPPS